MRAGNTISICLNYPALELVFGCTEKQINKIFNISSRHFKLELYINNYDVQQKMPLKHKLQPPLHKTHRWLNAATLCISLTITVSSSSCG